MIEPKILWKGNLSEDQLEIDIVEESNRAIDPKVESKLKSAWKKRIAEAEEKGAIWYDGLSYRLENLVSSGNKLKLTVSPYKFSVRSTLKKIPELENLGEKYYSHGLSVGGFVHTKDDKYVFGVKGDKSMSSLKEDIIGGVLEKIEPASGEGIFNMNRQELKEEINVDKNMIVDMKVLGLVRSSSTDIVIVTFTNLSVSSDELLEVFENREDDELDSMKLVNSDRLNNFLEGLGGYKPLMGQLVI